MADQSGDNGNSIVAIFALIVIAGMAIAFFMYALPRMQGKDAQPGETNIQIDMPTPSEGGAAEPAPQP